MDKELETPGPLDGLFESGDNVLRAIVAAEILSPPLALRESSNWQTPQRKPLST